MHDIIPNDTEASQAVPIVDVTVNAGFTIRAVMPDTPGSWWVAAEDTGRGDWVTWHCAAGTGDFAGTPAWRTASRTRSSSGNRRRTAT